MENWIDPNHAPSVDDYDYDDTDDSGTLHVLPANDIMRHTLSPDCWCKPEFDPDGEDLLYVHFPLDGRDGDYH